MTDRRLGELALHTKNWALTVSRHRDLLLVMAVIGFFLIFVIPLPPVLIDFLLVCNITLAILTLVTVIYVIEPLQFSTFPTLLLFATVFRLVLNVATTRLILSYAGTEGDDAAGTVVKTFGTFVGGENAIVGVIIFIVIVVIQFVVITKGATRISEVAARFTLDAMPGKQMAIDADLNAGMITEVQARERRQKISREADFYGSMDGASKFVRGDAVAGIVITLINIAGGFALGTLMYGLTAAESARVFTTLTIGDGLVSQLPGLVMSLAAGLLVTRHGQESKLGEEFLGQIFSSPKALYVSAGFLILLMITPLPKGPLLGVGAGLLGIAWIMQWVARDQAEAVAKKRVETEAKQPEKVDSLLGVNSMDMEVGYSLVGLVDAKQGGDLLDRIVMIRRQMALDLGVVVPPIRIRDNMQLAPTEYRVKVRGVEVAKGQVEPDQFLAMDSGLATEPVEGIKTREPAFGFPAVWIPEARKERAEALGYTVVSSSAVIATHLTEVIRDHADQILNREDVNNLINTLKGTNPTLVQEVIGPEKVKPGDLQKVLQALLRERVSIRDLATIVETVGDYVSRTKDPEILVEYVRAALARTICDSVKSSDGRLRVVTLDPRLEEFIRGATEQTEQGAFITLSPAMVQKIQNAVIRGLEPLTEKGYLPAVLCSPQVRRQVRKLMERTAVRSVAVLSYNEISRGVDVESLGTVAIEA